VSSAWFPDERRMLMALFALSLFVRVLVLLPVIGNDVVLQADESEYYRRAVAIERTVTGWLAGDDVPPRTSIEAYGAGVHPPLQPLILSISLFSRESTAPARLMVVLISALTTPLVYLVTGMVSNRRAAVVAAITHAIYPSFVVFSHLLWAETTCVFFLMSGVYFLLSALDRDEKQTRHALLASLCLSLASMAHAAAFPYGIVALIVVFWSRSSIRGRARLTAAMALVSIVSLLPWEAVLFEREGRFVLLSTAAPYNLYLGNNPWQDSDRYEPEIKDLVKGAASERAAATAIERADAFRELALEEIERHPFRFALHSFQRLRVMGAIDRTLLRHVLHAAYPPMPNSLVVLIWLLAGVSLILFSSLAIWGLIAADIELKYRYVLVSLLAAGMVPALITVADTRMTLPLFALLLPAVGHGAARLGAGPRDRRTAGAALAISAVVALNAASFSVGRSASPKTSSYYRPLMTRVDALLGSDTPYTDRISFRVKGAIPQEVEIRILSGDYRFHDTQSRHSVWEIGASQSAITLRIYGWNPSAPLRLQLRSSEGGAIELEPVNETSWRRWHATGLQGIEYCWRGGGPPPPTEPDL
jgi:4-amino-4-deoxy-L-arabinose transferase-like glycosyltransferase